MDLVLGIPLSQYIRVDILPRSDSIRVHSKQAQIAPQRERDGGLK